MDSISSFFFTNFHQFRKFKKGTLSIKINIKPRIIRIERICIYTCFFNQSNPLNPWFHFFTFNSSSCLLSLHASGNVFAVPFFICIQEPSVSCPYLSLSSHPWGEARRTHYFRSCPAASGCRTLPGLSGPGRRGGGRPCLSSCW